MIGHTISVELEEIIKAKDWNTLREVLADLHDSDIAELLIDLPVEDEGIIFRLLPRQRAGDVFAYMPADRQQELAESLSHDQMKMILEGMTPDDQTRLLEELPAEVTRHLLETLSPEKLKVARQLLGYPPESAGRYMTPYYVALRPNMTVAEALENIRQSPRATETLAVVFVVNEKGLLLQDLRLGTLVRAAPTDVVGLINDRPLASIPATMNREEVVREFARYDRAALPVTDAAGHMLGIITADDVIDVAEAVVTEDMQKLGGMAALEEPYISVKFSEMLRQRGGWLSVLFVGELLTASAMGYFEHEISQAVVLALFVPLIISSGGNSGSQATTLIIRALSLEEIRLRDWARVLYREIGSGLALGAWLGFLGFFRVMIWKYMGWHDYSGHFFLVGLTVWISVTCVVTFGTTAGSMLPFILRRAGFDPATSSAPFVATLVDVSGLVIYFSIAFLILKGTLL